MLADVVFSFQHLMIRRQSVLIRPTSYNVDFDYLVKMH